MPSLNLENSIIAEASLPQKNTWMSAYNLTNGEPPPVLYLHTLLKEVNLGALYRSVEALVNRHESLRTVFPVIDGVVKQAILPYTSEVLPVYFYDLSNDGNFSDKCVSMQQEIANGLWNLERGPLGSVLVLKGAHHYVLYFMIHHIISDAWSIKIIREELNIFYKAFVNGTVPSLAPLTYQLRDYCREQSLYFSVNEKSGIAYWTQKLGGINLLLNFESLYQHYSTTQKIELPADIVLRFQTREEFIRVLNGGRAFSFVKTISLAQFRGAAGLHKKFGCSIGPVLYGSFYLLLYFLTKKQRILFALPVADRYTPDKRSVVGNLMGSIYLYRTISPHDEIKQLILEIQMEYLKSCRHIIFDHPSVNINGQILRENCDLYINFASREINGSRQEAAVTEEGHKGEQNIHYALECFIFEYESLLSFNWRYNSAMFSRQLIEYIAVVHERIVMGLMKDECIKVCDLMNCININ